MKPIVLTPEQRRQIERRRKDSRDRRVYQRLTAVLIVAEGKKPRRSRSSVGYWPEPVGRMAPRLSQQGTRRSVHSSLPGRSRASSAPTRWINSKRRSARAASATPTRSASGFQDTFGVSYSPTGMKDLLRRVGVSYHKVSGFLWKADPDKQHAFVKRIARHQREAKRPAAPRTRRYYVDACHPVWGLDLVYCCWLLVGQRLLVGMGSGRKRLNILGGYCPDDHEYIDYRLTRDNINGEQFVNFLRFAAVAASPDRAASSCTWTGHATTAAPLSRSGCDGIRSFTCRRSRHTPPTST